MSSTAADAAPELGALTGFRDRLAHLGAKRQRLLTNGCSGLAMAVVVLSACRIPTPLSSWSWLLALLVIGLAMVRVRLGAAAMVCACTVQALSLNGQLGVVTAFLGILFVVVCEQQAVRWSALLLAPYLLRVGLGIGVPLGLALSAGRRSAWFWTLLAFLWCVVHGLAVGQPRLGVVPLPSFAQAAQKLKPPTAAKPGESAKATEPARSGTAAAKSARTAKPAAVPLRRKVVFNGDWLRTALGEADLSELGDAATQVLVKTGKKGPGPLIAQLLLWVGIAASARALYSHRRLKDRLALEYLEKMTRQVQHAAVPVYRRLPVAMFGGMLAFVVGYFVLAAVSKDILYGPLQAVLDVASVALAFLPLWAGLEGDAQAGRRDTASRRAEQKAGHAFALKDLPVGGAEASRRAGAFRSGAPAAAGGRAPGGAAAGAHPEAASPGAGPPGAVGERPAAAPSAAAVSSPAVSRPAPGPGPALSRSTTSHGGRASSAVEAVMFIDMVGSTAMGSKYGDEFVFKLKEHLGQTVRAECKKQGVLFVKGTGDGFMLTFPEAENAVCAGMNILREVRRENEGVAESRSVHLRMGVHMGQVNIDPRGDRIGTTANFAARIEGAKLEQLQAAEDPGKVQLPERDRILVSDVVHEELKDNPGYPMRPVGYFEFKGITGLHRIYEVLVR
jgi:class 3 adenylate cyclase